MDRIYYHGGSLSSQNFLENQSNEMHLLEEDDLFDFGEAFSQEDEEEFENSLDC